MLSLSNLISQTWLLYFRNFRTYLKVSFWIFLFTIPSAGLSLFLDSLRQPRIINLLLSIFVNLAVFVLTILLTIVLVKVADKQLSAQSAGRLSAAALAKAERPSAESLKSEFKTALNLWPRVLLIAILVALIQLGGFLLLIVPGIIFSVWFAFALYYVILGDSLATSSKSVIKESLRQSRELVRGRFWGILLRIFAPAILWSLFSWAITMIFMNSLDLIVKVFVKAPDAVTLLNIPKLIGTTYINALLVPLFVITMVILFRNLQKK